MVERPTDRLYGHRHLWVRVDDGEGVATVGLTDDMAERLPEIISLDMPMIDDELELDNDCLHMHLESGIKIVYSPLTGRVLEVNRDVLDNPELLHVSPYDSWLFKMEYDEEEELDMLMQASKYNQYLDQLSG